MSFVNVNLRHCMICSDVGNKHVCICMYFIWQNPFRLQIVVKSIKNQAFLDSTEDSAGKYSNTYCFRCDPRIYSYVIGFN